MFFAFGRLVARLWWVLLAGWVGLLAVGLSVRPPLASVTEDGEFAFLPPDVASRRGERVFEEGFSRDLLRSSVVIVLRRPDRPGGLIDADELPDDAAAGGAGMAGGDAAFRNEILLPRLESLLIENGWYDPDVPPDGAADDRGEAGREPPDDRRTVAGVRAAAGPIVARIRRPDDPAVGELLRSSDGEAELIILDLTTEFGDAVNQPMIGAVEDLVGPEGELRRDGLVPSGLELALSGSAMVGRDMRVAAFESGRDTHVATVTLVIVLLLAIYRAPLLALIPLATVFVGVETAMSLLQLLAERGRVGMFAGIEIYVTVVIYGAGIDYCMFLMSRYREELERGAEGGSFDPGAAVAGAIGHVGPALAASAGTTGVGIGMMVFASFGKFREAGTAITVSLAVVLVAALTFAPALLRMFGRWAYWPRTPGRHATEPGGWVAPESAWKNLAASPALRQFWATAAAKVARRPGRWWSISCGLMLPLALFGWAVQDRLTYGLLSELSEDAASVRGVAAVQAHFPAGDTGPATVLLTSADTDFGDFTGDGEALIGEVADRLWSRRGELGLADIRTLADPLGRARGLEIAEVLPKGRSVFERLTARGGARVSTKQYYVADTGPDAGRTTRLDVIFQNDPFSRESVDRLDTLESAVMAALPDELEGSRVDVIGPTASIRDLAEVTGRDQTRIQILVMLGVAAVLVMLLREVGLTLYLIATVLLSYFVALGFTFLVFWALDPANFAGLDWKVPVFLFTILVAVGEDYNIYLVTRVREEQPRLGPVAGITAALSKTGAIISSCGLIMAGDVRLADVQFAHGDGATRLRTGVRRAAGHVRGPPDPGPRVPAPRALRPPGPLGPAAGRGGRGRRDDRRRDDRRGRGAISSGGIRGWGWPGSARRTLAIRSSVCPGRARRAAPGRGIPPGRTAGGGPGGVNPPVVLIEHGDAVRGPTPATRHPRQPSATAPPGRSRGDRAAAGVAPSGRKGRRLRRGRRHAGAGRAGAGGGGAGGILLVDLSRLGRPPHRTGAHLQPGRPGRGPLR